MALLESFKYVDDLGNSHSELHIMEYGTVSIQPLPTTGIEGVIDLFHTDHYDGGMLIQTKDEKIAEIKRAMGKFTEGDFHTIEISGDFHHRKYNEIPVAFMAAGLIGRYVHNYLIHSSHLNECKMLLQITP